MMQIILGFFLLTSLYQPIITDEERGEEFPDLNWQAPGTYRLPHSNATLTVPENYIVAIGNDASFFRFLYLDDAADNWTEAVLYDEDTEEIVVFENYRDGYVSLHDWNAIDPEAFFEALQYNIEMENEKNEEAEDNQVQFIDWIYKPQLNKKNKTVSWAIELKSSTGQSYINTTAIKLGRKSLEKIIYTIHKEAFNVFDDKIDLLLEAFNFDQGFQYEDFVLGDKVAEDTIATLFTGIETEEEVLDTDVFWGVLYSTGGGLAAILVICFFERKSLKK